MRRWNYKYQVQELKKKRLIIHTDCKNEADDQFAVAHQLMTPQFDIRGIVAGHFNGKPMEWGERNTAQASFDEVHKVLQLMDVEGICPVAKGAECPLEEEQTPVDSDGARLIIREAMKEDSVPLYIGMQGSLTDLASAILLKPEICNRMTAIWVGGGEYPTGGSEFNLSQDIHAANVLMNSNMPVWQIPVSAYRLTSVSLAELQCKVYPYGKIGKYLFEQIVEFNNRYNDTGVWPQGETWCLGDSTIIGALLAEEGRAELYEMIPAPTFDSDMKYRQNTGNRKIRVYKEANTRLLIEDFFAKMSINYPDWTW